MHTDFFENLKGQTLDDEMIKKIQAESGKDVTDAKNKMQNQIEQLNNQIAELQGQVSQRETDMEDLKTKLKEAGQSSTKLGEVQQAFDDLKTKYNTESENYKNMLAQQKYEFLVREKAGTIGFSSNAAKDNFIEKLKQKNLPVENDTLLGFDDYLNTIKEQDPGAFIVEDNGNNNNPPANFSNPNNNQNNGNNNNTVNFGWNFTGVRKHDK